MTSTRHVLRPSSVPHRGIGASSGARNASPVGQSPRAAVRVGPRRSTSYEHACLRRSLAALLLEQDDLAPLAYIPEPPCAMALAIVKDVMGLDGLKGAFVNAMRRHKMLADSAHPFDPEHPKHANLRKQIEATYARLKSWEITETGIEATLMRAACRDMMAALENVGKLEAQAIAAKASGATGPGMQAFARELGRVVEAAQQLRVDLEWLKSL